MNVGDALGPEALDMNRSGRLSDEQRRALRGRSWSLRKSELNLAVVVTIIGLVVWLAPGPAGYATLKPLFGVAALIVAAFLLWRALTGVDSLTEDVRAGEVRSVDGAIAKHVVSTSGRTSGTTRHYFDVAGQRLHVDSANWYRLAPDAGWVRIFYLPRSRRVVNLEVLPGPEVPQVTPALTHDLSETLRAAVRSHNETQVAEARALGKAVGDRFKQEMQEAAVPPPARNRDPRPLGVAIVGSWSNPFMTVAFAGDGTATLTMPGGHSRPGRWSIGDDGKLHTDALGQKASAEAWISGDQLTIAMDGRGLTFTRLSGG